MINRPTFSPILRVDVQEDKLLLGTSGDFTVIESPICVALAPHLKGEKTSDEIISLLGSMYPVEELYYGLLLLEHDGFLIDADSVQHNSIQEFWQAMGYPPSCISSPPLSQPVSVRTVGIENPPNFQSMLEDMQISVSSESTFQILLVSDYLHPEIDGINKEALINNHRLFLIKPFGTKIWLGPLIAPGHTGCWKCLKHRLELNRPSDMYFSESGNRDTNSQEFLSPEPVNTLGLSLAALETAKLLLSVNMIERGKDLVTFDLKTLESRKHLFVSRPQCPACGDSSLNSSTNPRIFNKSSKLKRDFSYRVCPPEDTLQRFKHHVSPVTGIIRSLTKVNANDSITHNYTAHHSARLRDHSIESLRLQTRDKSGGKGKTDGTARTSALCEAIERFSAVYDHDSPARYAKYFTLGEKALHPESLLLFSRDQYEQRETWNKNLNGNFHWVPEPLDNTVEIAWTQAWSLTCNTTRFVPTAYCYFGFDGPGSTYCRADSNGLASGNCFEEAVLYGLLELMERDAVGIWWYNKLRYPQVNLHSFKDPYFESIIAHHELLKRELWVLDITNDLEIPTFVAVSRKKEGEKEDILLGFGAHFDGSTAVTRAILEVNQLLPTVIRSRPELENHLLPDFADALSWWNLATIKNQPFLLPQSNVSETRAEAHPSVETIDLFDKLNQCIEKLKGLGLEILVIDHSRPDIGLPVARVIVPGLRHFWRRMAPGRLYQVPIKMKKRDKPLSETQLNPISLFL